MAVLVEQEFAGRQLGGHRRQHDVRAAVRAAVRGHEQPSPPVHVAVVVAHLQAVEADGLAVAGGHVGVGGLRSVRVGRVEEPRLALRLQKVSDLVSVVTLGGELFVPGRKGRFRFLHPEREALVGAKGLPGSHFCCLFTLLVQGFFGFALSLTLCSFLILLLYRSWFSITPWFSIEPLGFHRSLRLVLQLVLLILHLFYGFRGALSRVEGDALGGFAARRKDERKMDYLFQLVGERKVPHSPTPHTKNGCHSFGMPVVGQGFTPQRDHDPKQKSKLCKNLLDQPSGSNYRDFKDEDNTVSQLRSWMNWTEG